MSAVHKVHKMRFEGGITLIGEEIPHLASAAFTMLLGAGAASDPESEEGAAGLLAEMLQKGAGDYDARGISEQFESLGAHRSHNAGIEVSTISSAQLSEHLESALSLYATILKSPHLPETELPAVQALAKQDLLGLEDEPASKVMDELARRFYPNPFNRSQYGTMDGIQACSVASLRDYFQKQYCGSELIIAVAGSFDWERLRACVQKEFSWWNASGQRLEAGELPAESKSYHVEKDTSQVQIALAYPSVSFEDPHYYAAKLAVSILSGGMSGRLFIEVREKRGLVYRVSASQSAARGRAAIFASAGTTPENAEETLAVMYEQLANVGKGVSDEELQRAKADLKSKVIIRGESSYVRSASLVNDWWNIGRVRSLQEIKEGIDAVTKDDIAAYAETYPVAPLTLMSLGPKSLELPK